MKVYQVIKRLDGTWYVPSLHTSHPLVTHDDKAALLRSACALAKQWQGEVHVIDEFGFIVEIYRHGDSDEAAELDVTRLDISRMLTSN